MTYTNKNCLDQSPTLSYPFVPTQNNSEELSQFEYAPCQLKPLPRQHCTLAQMLPFPSYVCFPFSMMFILHANLRFMFASLGSQPAIAATRSGQKNADTKMGYWSLTTCQSPGNEDPITDGRWSSCQKVVVKLLNCSLVVNGVAITGVNALVGPMYQVFEKY